MNASHDEIEKALARPVQADSALSEAEYLDWSQQDPRTVVQKIRVLEAFLIGYIDLLAAKQDKTVRMIFRANPSFAEGFDAVIDGFKQAFGEVKGSRALFPDKASVHACAQEVVSEVSRILTEAGQSVPGDEPVWLRQERIALACKSVCIGFRGMLYAVECMTRAEAAYDDDYRRGVLRALALIGILPHHIERLLPHIEDLGFHLYRFEAYISDLVISH